MKKSQTWSTDAIVAVIIFTFVAMSFFYITGKSTEKKGMDEIAQEAKKIPDLFTQSGNSSFSFIENNKINIKKLENISTISYDELKRQIGIINDFCIHFEDENGNIIFINSTNNISGIGNC